MSKKYKVIVDTDPGCDDAACLIYMLNDKNVDIKLISTVAGNIKVETATRNALHLLDLFNKDIPLTQGAEKAICRTSPYAEEIHQKEGLGGYNPPSTTSRQAFSNDAVEEIYKVLKEGNGDIIPIVLGPQTNFGLLFQKHPDIISKIPKIIFMGGSPYGVQGFPNHISFNISSDPEAFKIVLDSKIPLVMIPSDMGRRKAYLDEQYVYNMKSMNEVGDLLFRMYDLYWEPGFDDKRIATNDTCAYMYLIRPEIFQTTKIEVDVDLNDAPGKTTVYFDDNGHIDLAIGVKREQFLKIMTKKLIELNGVKLPKVD